MQARARLGVWSLLAVLVAGCGGSEDEAATTTPELSEGKILAQDSFAHPASGWDSRVAEEGESGYIEGAYRILVKNEEWFIGSDRGFEPRLDALRLEVEATQVAGTNGDLVGALCYTDVDSDVGYQVGIASAERGYAIDAFRGR